MRWGSLRAAEEITGHKYETRSAAGSKTRRRARRGTERGVGPRSRALDARSGRVLLVREKKERHLKPEDPPEWGERSWAGDPQDRESRFVVAHASGRRREETLL